MANDAVRVVRGRIERFCAHYAGHKFHALLCDPPYELGFMGRRWDKSGVAFDSDIWAAITEHLLPGAFGVAFASSRGWHRLACAIEDAGLIIHPSIFGWAFGSGFPKATRIDTQVDKAAGAEREVKEREYRSAFNSSQAFGGETHSRSVKFSQPATPLAAAWAGHRYGLQALKPALEPIIVFQKPYQGRPVDSITCTGAGALWIEGARIGTDAISAHGGGHGIPALNPGVNPHAGRSGRWPANFYLEHSADCTESCAPDCPVERLGGQSEEGAAARFFLQVDRALDEADPVFYCAKASRRERDAGLAGFNLREVGTMDDDAYRWRDDVPGGRSTKKPMGRNPHPTVKPIALARYLATLLLPPGAYAPRRILVPFAGSGSELIGAALAGWEMAVGIEQEREYVELARKRHRWWALRARELGVTDPATLLKKAKPAPVPSGTLPGQLALWEDGDLDGTATYA